MAAAGVRIPLLSAGLESAVTRSSGTLSHSRPWLCSRSAIIRSRRTSRPQNHLLLLQSHCRSENSATPSRSWFAPRSHVSVERLSSCGGNFVPCALVEGGFVAAGIACLPVAAAVDSQSSQKPMASSLESMTPSSSLARASVRLSAGGPPGGTATPTLSQRGSDGATVRPEVEVKVQAQKQSSKQRHDAIIVGGGLGGLATAIALRRHGVDAHVYEKRESIGGGEGTMIVLYANGLHALSQICPDIVPKLRDAGCCDFATLLVNPDGTHIPVKAWQAPRSRIAIRWRAVLDLLHQKLPPHCIHLDHSFQSLQQMEDGSVSAQFLRHDGSSAFASAPVLIGADGIRSEVRRTVFGMRHEDVVRDNGRTVWRTMVDFDSSNSLYAAKRHHSCLAMSGGKTALLSDAGSNTLYIALTVLDSAWSASASVAAAAAAADASAVGSTADYVARTPAAATNIDATAAEATLYAGGGGGGGASANRTTVNSKGGSYGGTTGSGSSIDGSTGSGGSANGRELPRRSKDGLEAVERLRELYAGWEMVQHALNLVDPEQMLERRVLDLHSIGSWVKGNVVLIGGVALSLFKTHGPMARQAACSIMISMMSGILVPCQRQDAAHAITPAIGQGANLAFEDAWELGEFLHGADNVREALEAFEFVRMPRAHLIAGENSARAKRAYVEDPILSSKQREVVYNRDEFMFGYTGVDHMGVIKQKKEYHG